MLNKVGDQVLIYVPLKYGETKDNVTFMIILVTSHILIFVTVVQQWKLLLRNEPTRAQLTQFQHATGICPDDLDTTTSTKAIKKTFKEAKHTS